MLSIILFSMFCWLLVFKISKGVSGVAYAIRGGGGDDPEPPAPPPPAPSPMETSEQAINAQLNAIPKQLEAQREYAPQFTQLQLDNLREFGPQFSQEALDLEAEFGPQIAQQTREQQDILDPSRAAGSEALLDFLEAGPQGLSEEDIRAIEQSSRSAAASRGLSSSGFSAKDEILKNFGARQNLKSRYLDVALSASGRLPAGASQTTSANPLSTGQQGLVSNVNPSQFFGAQASNNALAGSIYNTQGSIFGNQLAAGSGGGVGSLIGGIAGTTLGALAGGVGAGVGGSLGSKLGGAVGGCWVAAEIFGGWEKPKTHAARLYINLIGPKWFCKFYNKHGEKFAKFISDKPVIKMLLRPLFELFARKGMLSMKQEGNCYGIR